MQFIGSSNSRTSVHEELDCTGKALCRNVTLNEAWALAATLGHIDQKSNFAQTVILSPSIRPRHSNTLSARYGHAELPHHTECAYWKSPPRYLGVWCEVAGTQQQATTFADVSEVWETLHKTQQSHPSGVLLTRGERSFRTSVVDVTVPGGRLRWDPHCLVFDDPKWQRQANQILSRPRVQTHQWSAGDFLILNNWRVLHGRGSSKSPDYTRRLHRIIIKSLS